MELIGPILFLLILAVPISVAVRLAAALVSERVRHSIARHPIAHSVWFAAAVAVVILSLWLSPPHPPKPPRLEQGQNKVFSLSAPRWGCVKWGGRGPFRGLCWRAGGRRTGATENKPKIAYVHPDPRSQLAGR
jgi:hypothetical protein